MSIGVRIQRDPNTGTIVSPTKPVKLGFVGESYGGTTPVVNQPLNLTVSDGTADTFADATVCSIQRVALTASDYIDTFKQGSDYQLTSPNTLTWLNAAMTPPELEGVIVSTDGSIGTDAVYYKITVFDQNSEESTPSSALTLQATSGVANQHRLYWSKIPFASAYRVYRSADGTDYGHWIYTSLSGNTVTYDVDGSESITDVAIPTTNKARRVPKTGTGTDSTYYADYTKVEFDYDVKSYNRLTDVITDHGKGSDIANMARILFQQYNVPEVYICATDGTNNSAYQDAIDKFANIADVNYLVALKNSAIVQNYVVTHCDNYSQESQKKERFAVVALINTVTTVGAATTSGTVLYWLANLGGYKRAYPIVPNGNVVYADQWEDRLGVFTETVKVENHFLAGAIAGMIVTRGDVATSIIGQQIRGFSSGVLSPAWNDNIERDKIMDAGGTYIQNVNGILKVYNDNTNDTSLTENAERVVVSGEDELKRRLRTTLDSFIGRKLSSGTLKAIKNAINNTLSILVQDVIIESFNVLEVKQNASVLTQVDVTLSYKPIYPIKEIVVTYSFDV